MAANKVWQLKSLPENQSVVLSGYSPVMARLLVERGLSATQDLNDFFAPGIFSADYFSRFDPYLFADMAKAVDLIIAHIKQGDSLMVYGDYDADGITATAILWETLVLLKAKVDYYLPDRVSEGYGLNKEAVEKIAAAGCRLLITVDNGTRSFDEVVYARNLGLEIIVTDHHALPEDENRVPDCLFINCSDARQKYPSRQLAGVGVAFKLVQALLSKANLPEDTKRKVWEKALDLVAVGTIADMMPLLGENRLLVKSGLEILNQNKRPGLKALVQVAKINTTERPLDAWSVGFQIAPRLNAASRLGHASNALSLLLTKDENEAKTLAEELNQKNSQRQKVTEEIMTQVEAQIDQNNIPFLIVGNDNTEEAAWNEGVIGLVAGRICEKYYRPTLIITKIGEGFKGSGRSIKEFNLIAAIEKCREHLDKYGGHSGAAGFSGNSQEQLNSFLGALSQVAKEELTGLELAPKLEIDLELKPGEISLELAKEIEALAPFGQGNPEPKFVSYGLTINDIVKMGNGEQHIKFRFGALWALGFFKSEDYGHLCLGDQVDLVYYLGINGYNGHSEAQLKIIDIKKTK